MARGIWWDTFACKPQVRFQYVYCLAVYLCQIPHVLEALTDGWAAAGLDKAVTTEDLGLYLKGDTADVPKADPSAQRYPSKATRPTCARGVIIGVALSHMRLWSS